MTYSSRVIAVLLIGLWVAHLQVIPAMAQSVGAIRGTVFDPSGAVIPTATVEVQNVVAHYDHTVSGKPDGTFDFTNVPFNNYHLSINAPGFQTATQDVDLRSSIPVDLKIQMKLGEAATAVTVEESSDLVETDPTTHTDIDRGLFDKLPLESSSSSLSSLVTLASPGIAADSNGLFHGMGDHAENSFSVDGQPITDQQSKVFSNQIPMDSVQSLEVIEGAPPAEYGDKTSVVIVVTTRSGLGVTQPHGSVNSSYGSFGTTNAGFDISYGSNKLGNFMAANGMDTGRFLDGPEFGVLHSRGNQQNIFDRVDLKPTNNDSLNLNFGFTRSWFQTPNSYDAQNATAWSGLVVDNGGLGPNGLPVGPQDQRSKIATFNLAPSWTRILSPTTAFTAAAFVRQDRYNYYASPNPFADLTPGLQLQTVGQARRLTNAGFHTDLTWATKVHNLKAGFIFEDTLLTENDRLGIVDPTFNAPCLNPDGSPDTDPTPNNPASCGGSLSPNPAFTPVLGCYDLTRSGAGCPNSATAPYLYAANTSIKQAAAYVQDAITAHNWTFNLGLRADSYHGLSDQNELEPRLGVSYNIKPSTTVLRASYARTQETPFNENLILASLGCNDAVVNAIMSAAGPCNTAPLAPGFRNEFHLGLQQAFGKYLVFDGEYIWKYTHGAYDFSILGNTPITFPIQWHNSKIPGFALRTSVPDYHGFSALVVMSHVTARFFTPQLAGIGAAPGDIGVFRIDHDEVFNQTTHLQYQPTKRAPWISFNWRYDSGLVAGPVPCAGGNCNNGPNGTDTLVDASGLTPAQQFAGGLFCGSVHATPTTPISSDSTCPASQYGSTLIKIPAAGTEDDDHNPPRIAPRHLFDIGVGHDNIFNGDRYKWSGRIEVINVANKVALYNFFSTFSGTHYVTPRTISATVGFHF